VFLIVDAYNVLHKWRGGPLAGDADDLLALARLIEKSRYAAGPITLVCDGNPPPMAAFIHPSLRYSGPGRTADDLIEDLIADHSAPRRLTVASSDRRIIAAAKRRGATSIDADSFLAQVVTDAGTQRPEPLDKDALADASAASEWMDSLDIPAELLDIPSSDLKPAPPPPPPKKPEPRKPSPAPRKPETDDDIIRRALEGLGPPTSPHDDNDDLDMERWLKEGPKRPPL